MDTEPNAKPTRPALEDPLAPSALGGSQARRTDGLQGHGDSYGPGYGYGYGYGQGAGQAGGLEAAQLADYLKVVYRWRWVCLATFLAIAMGTTAYTYTRVPLYQSGARLLIQTQRETFGLKDISAFDAGPGGNQTQVAILRSRSVARRAMTALGLLGPPSVSPKAETGAEYEAPQVDELSTYEPDQVAAIDGFRASLSVGNVPGTGLVDVVYSSTDAETAARCANAVAQAFVIQSRELKSLATRGASAWLSDRLQEQRSKVEASERALAKYREQHNVLSVPDGSNPMVQNLTSLAMAVTKAKTDRIEKETTHRRLQGIKDNPDALESFPAVLSDPAVQRAKADVAALEREYARLSEKLGELHPELIRIREAIPQAKLALQQQISRVADSSDAEVRAARAAESNMVSLFEQQKQEAFSANRGGVELAVLARDLESNRQIYDSLMKQAKEVNLTGEIESNNIRVLDAAQVPRAPIWPNYNKNIQYGVVSGFALALGLAFFLEFVDSRIKSPAEVTKYLGLPFLGLVPSLDPQALRDMAGTKSLAPPAHFGEAFRNIRTNVLFSFADPGFQSVAVTSTQPSEGKTVVASNLAMSIAESGRRVIIIDADLRRPRLHTVLGVPQEPGLSNILVGNVNAPDAVKPTKFPGLRVIPAGRLPPNPAELLGSKRFKDLMTALRGHVDWVILDCPPVMAVSDSTIVAHAASGVLFVIGAGSTSRSNARTALEQLRRVRANVVGAVLNKVDFKRQGYYYSDYYRRDYAKYYRADQRASS